MYKVCESRALVVIRLYLVSLVNVFALCIEVFSIIICNVVVFYTLTCYFYYVQSFDVRFCMKWFLILFHCIIFSVCIQCVCNFLFLFYSIIDLLWSLVSFWYFMYSFLIHTSYYVINPSLFKSLILIHSVHHFSYFSNTHESFLYLNHICYKIYFSSKLPL